MNSKQEAKLNMYDAVLTHCENNSAIVATVPAFQTAVDAFEDIVDDLRNAAQNELQAISGYTQDKTQQRADLIELTLDVAGAIHAYATSVDNLVLKEQVKLVYSDLNRLKDELLGPACTNILDAANNNAAAIVPFGVTAAKITALDDAIEDYLSAVPAHRNAVSNRSSVGEQIKQLFKDGDALLKNQLDKLALQFKATEPNFYNSYRNNRIILDAATSSTQVSGVVTEQGTNNPLENVTITVVDQSYTTVTDSSGEYNLKIPVPGEYDIVFTKTGYQAQTFENVELTLGQNTDLDVVMNFIPT